MNSSQDAPKDLALLVLQKSGKLLATKSTAEPFHIIDKDGKPVACVREYFRELQARGQSVATIRSYGMDILRWFRFCWTAGFAWDRATRAEARDFSRWMQIGGSSAAVVDAGAGSGAISIRKAYSVSVRAHSETVLRGFYDFHLEAGSGPILNPFPLDRSRRGGRAHAHQNPMEPYRNERSGRYRPKVPNRIPRNIPDQQFNEIFAQLPSHRDRALVAFYVSTGARASELLSAKVSGVDPGRQLITVVRKGTREQQQLPASTDAFVWLRLYQSQMGESLPEGPHQPLWWTLRRPARPLTYHAVHRMFERTNARAGTDSTLHALRHTAAYRMAEDPAVPLTDVQYVLGHAQLTTTQIYLTPRKEEVIARVLTHHAQAAKRTVEPPVPAPGYRPETLQVLFGNQSS